MAAAQHINDSDLAEILSRHAFIEEQVEQIKLGVVGGLTKDQIELYARPQFNASTMRVIRKALESGLPPEKVRELARPSLDWEQMLTLFYGLREGWPMPLIEWIADSVIDGDETTEHGMHFECVVDTIDLLFDEGWIRTEEERESAQTRD